jgi:hypothetical protein
MELKTILLQNYKIKRSTNGEISNLKFIFLKKNMYKNIKIFLINNII